MYIPFLLEVSAWHILVLGGGKVAFRKMRRFLSDTEQPEIVVVAPSLSTDMRALSDAGKIVWENRRVKAAGADALVSALASEFAYFSLAICATEDTAVNAAVAAACQRRHILVCRTDEAFPQVIFPSQVPGDTGLVRFASTLGQYPKLTRRWRAREEHASWQAYTETRVHKLGRWRAWVLQNVADPNRKEALLEEALDWDAEELDRRLAERGNA